MDYFMGCEVHYVTRGFYFHRNLLNMFSQDMTTAYPLTFANFTMSSTFCKAPENQGPDFSAFQRVVKSLFPEAQTQNIRLLEGHTHPIHILQMSNGQELVLKTSPLPTTSILRHERHRLETEATVLSILSQSRIEGIPQSLKFDIPRFPSRTAYLLKHSVRGVPLSETDLTPDERECLDRQLGTVVDVIGQHTSTLFGLVHSVALGAGTRTWNESFLPLLDALMWDAENVFISLPYPEIRHHAVRLSAALDDVTVPRLVVVDIGKPSHIIVNPKTKRMSGLVDFGSALWGDPLMADVFNSASPAFIDSVGSDLIESKSALIRLLLYSCYHNILKIVKQYYRSREGDEELDARRALTANLATLSTLEYP